MVIKNIMTKANKEYNKKLKSLRPFVNFNYDLRKPLSPQSKGKINRYYRELLKLNARENIKYKPRKKKYLKKAREITEQNRKVFQEFNTIFIPQPTKENKTVIKFSKNGTPYLTNKNIVKKLYAFDKINLIKNTDKEVMRIINKLPDDDNHRFSVAVGSGESWSLGFSEKALIFEDVINMLNRYNIESVNGIYSYKFKNEKDKINYIISLSDFKNAKKKSKKKRIENMKIRQGNNEEFNKIWDN